MTKKLERRTFGTDSRAATHTKPEAGKDQAYKSFVSHEVSVCVLYGYPSVSGRPSLVLGFLLFFVVCSG